MSQNCQGGMYPRRTITCLDWVIAFFAWLFALTLGVILGAALYETFLPVLATVIVFAVVMLVGIIALLIYRFCVYWR